jgi:signal recognition particle subunit SRP54
MFDGLQDKLQNVFRDLRGEGRITPETLENALKQIRMALLEADVNFRVVKAFIERVRERAGSEEVLASLSGSQQVVKIVRDEMVALLGEPGSELRLDGRPAVIMLCGLQGSGKTTTAGKIAKRMLGKGRHPLLVAGDLQRAAAVEQLVQVGKGVDVQVLTPEPGEKVDALASRAVRFARDRGHDVMVFDTAGRLHVDEALMGEIQRLAKVLAPSETLFVADSMTGQDAVKSAGAFAAALPLTGAILTKLDGDTRGGAALSIRTVANVPIRFLGTGEKADDLELFQPDRMAGRILGMGDVLSLIERAERELDQDESRRIADKIGRQGGLTLEDLRDQMKQIRKLGSFASILEMLPKVGPLRGLDGMQVDDGQLKRVEAIIDSMTPLERRRPNVIDGSRKKRIARGSGTQVQEINQLLRQYQQMQKMMKGAQGKMLRKMLRQKA